MADFMTPGAPEVPSLESGGPAPKKPSSSLKIIIAIGAVVLLVALAGTAAWLFLMSQDDGDDTVVKNPGRKGSTAATTTVTVPIDRPAEPVQDVFKFRNIFAPTVAFPGTTTASAPTSGTPTPTGTTLTFTGITTEDGVAVAMVTYAGVPYTLSEGEAITGTAWSVITIEDTKSTPRLVMRYGDEPQPSLAPGQSIQAPQ